MIKTIFFFLIFVFSLHAENQNISVPKSWAHNREAIEKALMTSKFVKRTPMADFLKEKDKKADFTNQVFIIELENGMKAVFKYDYEERDMYGEIAAYNASKLTGIDCVPPTVIRAAYKMRGSLQLYIETTIDGALSEEAFTKAYQKVPSTERGDAEAFAFVFGQWDKSYGNFLFTSVPQTDTLGLILIDNAGTAQLQYVRIGESPFVRRMYSDKRKDKWTTEFPYDQVCEIPYDLIAPAQRHKRL